MDVACVRFDPSLSHSQISGVPDRSETNAIRLPFGEYVGWLSDCVDEMNWMGVEGFPRSRKSTRQMLSSNAAAE
jgi:hypothetical protein